ncbi:MAG: ABC transporter ATP-binding protein [Streptosporangiaceae bacterium]
MSRPVLRVRDLRAGYDAIRVLGGLDLDVEPGEIVGVAGLNGTGKTTLLRALSGMINRSCDVALLNGAPLPARPHAVARRGLVHVPEGRRVFPNLTVRDNLRYGAVAAGHSGRAAAAAAILEIFPPLAALSQRRAGLLSGGEQQMLAVARGLMARPILLMVDELSLGLSPRASKDIATVLAQAARDRGLSLLLVDQNVALLQSHCDRILTIRDGRARSVAGRLDHDAIDAAYF